MRYLVFGFHAFGYPLGVITCIDLNNIIINCGHIINFFPPLLAWKILALSHFCSMDLAVLGPIPLANILVNIHAVKLYDCTLISLFTFTRYYFFIDVFSKTPWKFDLAPGCLLNFDGSRKARHLFGMGRLFHILPRQLRSAQSTNHGLGSICSY